MIQTVLEYLEKDIQKKTRRSIFNCLKLFKRNKKCFDTVRKWKTFVESSYSNVYEEFPDIETTGLCEAEAFNRYLIYHYSLLADYLKIRINYAAYFAEIVQKDEKLCYAKEIYEMWNLEWYVNLLMVERPRQTDNEDGHGPKGKDFIAHVEVPIIVQKAFDELKYVYGKKTREAHLLYASK